VTPTMEEIRDAVKNTKKFCDEAEYYAHGESVIALSTRNIRILFSAAQSVLDGTLVKAATQDEVASIVYNTVYGDTPTPKQEMAVRLECMAIARALVGKVSSNEVTHTTECIVCGKPSPIMCDECVSKVPKK